MSHTCIKCGDEERCRYNEETVAALTARQHCFSCDFYWRFLNDPAPLPNRHHHSTAVIANGHIYTDGGNVENAGHDTRLLGFGGHKWHFRMLDGSREWVSNNVWHGGEIPEVWRKEIPDNAEIVQAQAAWSRA
jgi:hypothetical protein